MRSRPTHQCYNLRPPGLNWCSCLAKKNTFIVRNYIASLRLDTRSVSTVHLPNDNVLFRRYLTYVLFQVYSGDSTLHWIDFRCELFREDASCSAEWDSMVIRWKVIGAVLYVWIVQDALYREPSTTENVVHCGDWCLI